jgi:eukaryotic-like serine/threonine-protein kinase
MKLSGSFINSRTFRRNLVYALGITLVFLFFAAFCVRIYTHHGRSYAVPDFRNMSLEDAIELIENKNFRYEIFDSNYNVDKAAGTILDQHPVEGMLVKKNRKIFLTINSSSPGSIEMPNLVGITLREARIKIEAYGLKIGKMFYRYDISENVILEQQHNGRRIEAKDTIVKGSAIDLVLGKGLANTRRMVPNLIGMTIAEAELAAIDATFNIGAIIEDNSIAEASGSSTPFIFKQKPESNPEILRPLGSTISLYVTLDSTKLTGYNSTDDPDYIWNELNENNEADTSNTINSTL